MNVRYAYPNHNAIQSNHILDLIFGVSKFIMKVTENNNCSKSHNLLIKHELALNLYEQNESHIISRTIFALPALIEDIIIGKFFV